MTNSSPSIVQVQQWIKVLGSADPVAQAEARDELIVHSKRRIEALSRKMFFSSLRAQPRVDWEDVYQEAALRLWTSLDDAQPGTVKEFFGLAATQIRRVMLDMCRKFKKDPPVVDLRSGRTLEPSQLQRWTEFHERVNDLEPPEREVFELLWYHELTQQAAADVLGVDESTVKRRYRKAKLALADYVL